MQHRLFGLRGQSYVKRLKEIYAEEKDSILQKFSEICDRDGKFSAKALGEMCNHFHLPVTVMDDFLSEATKGVYPSGTWDRLKDRGVKARDIGVAWNSEEVKR